MANNLLHQNKNYINILAKAKTPHRKAIIKTADKELIYCLCECALNILNGNIPLKPNEYQKLSKSKTHLRKLASEKTSQKERRKILVQNGGFLPVLLAPILGIVGQLLADKLINKK